MNTSSAVSTFRVNGAGTTVQQKGGFGGMLMGRSTLDMTVNALDVTPRQTGVTGALPDPFGTPSGVGASAFLAISFSA
jgi:hypothetical protein